jgi:hypothetical protein
MQAAVYSLDFRSLALTVNWIAGGGGESFFIFNIFRSAAGL